jgi:cytochrome b subunit of formate dehydrogenase
MKLSSSNYLLSSRTFAVLTAVIVLIVVIARVGAFDRPAPPQDPDRPARAMGVCPPFPLRDEAGKVIDPVRGVNDGVPYSPKQTCGAAGCHDYAKITEGFHFTQGKGEAMPPEYAARYNWASSPGNYGGNWCSPAPLYRQLAPKRNSNPHTIDMTSFDFVTATCGNCHPGGGPMEYDRDGRRYDQRMAEQGSGLIPGGENGLDGDYYKARWSETGVIEADCLLCHMPEYDYGARNAQLANLNFRWAATDGARLGKIVGKVAAAEKPRVEYNKDHFDADGNVALHIVRTPRNETCLNCHWKPGWKKRGASFTPHTDVHLAKGLKCVDCHTAGSGASDSRIRGREVHQIGKGDDPSGWVRNDLDNTVRSCESCHADGTLGAPVAKHTWLPPLHLDRIACVTCHIPRRYTKAALVQASDVFNPAPRITPPPKHIWTFYDQDMKFWNHYGELDLFTVKDQPVNEFRPTLIRYKGKIFPANQVHSSWVGFEEDGKPGLNQLFMRDFFAMWTQHLSDPTNKYPELASITDDNKDGAIEVNRPEEIDALLAATRAYLAATGFPLEGRRLVYVSDDRKHSSAAMFEVLPHEPYEATPYASVYKYSHNVLPAKAALGAGGCKDCHAADSAFFFAPVVRYPFGPDGKPVYAAQHDIIGYDGSPREYGGVVAATQTFFRWLTVIVIGGMLIHIVLDIIARRRHAAAIPEDSADQSILRFNSHFLAQHLLLMTSVILLLFSGMFVFGTRYPGARWASALTGVLGGLDFWRVVHRVGASILVFVCGYHAIYSLIHPEGRRDFVLLLPRRRDFREFAQNLMWMVGKRRERPRFGRFAYFEKFDYWAVFWGCAIFFASGLAMWFPGMVRTVLPAVSPALFDALKEAHAHEAVLALLAIAVWHVYNVHLRPGRFPGSFTFIHGRIGRKEMTTEHPLEFIKELIHG